MEIQHLKYFVDAIEYGSFAKAAEELYVTRQTISNAINQLESELGFSLLVRNKNGVELTSDGALFYDRIKRQFEEFDKLQKDMLEHGSRYRISVKVGVAQYFEQKEVQKIERWIDQNPEFNAKLVFCGEQESVDMLEKGEVDFLLTMMKHSLNVHYTSEVVANHRLVLFVHKDNPLYEKDMIDDKDMEGQTILAVDHGATQYLNQGSMPNLDKCRIEIHNDAIYNISSMLENKGVMITIGGNVVFESLKNVKGIPFSEEYSYPYYLNVSAKTMRNKAYHKAYRSLKQYLLQEYEKDN